MANLQPYTDYNLDGDVEKNPLVVLVHGVGLNQSIWQDWLPVLRENYAVLTYDLYGHGGSANPDGRRTVKDFVTQLKCLIDSVGIAKFSLVGFSIGAIITQAFAYLHADRLNQAVFLHSVYNRSEAQCRAVRERYKITRDHGTHGPMAAVELAIKRWYSGEYIAANPDRMHAIRQLFAQHSDDGYLKAYYFFCHLEAEMRDYDMRKVHTPALVITGSADGGSTAAMSENLALDLANAELIINPNHLHMAMDEHANMIANQVRSFLEKFQPSHASRTTGCTTI